MNTLSSSLQIGEKCNLNFYKSGRIDFCEVCGVHFSESKVAYDIIVPIGSPEHDNAETIIYNVDSVYVNQLT